jgi:hypothetical protein
MKRLSLLILGLGLVLSTTIAATTIHVPADQATIQAGINMAVEGDTVLVAPGTYSENLTVDNKEIVLLSEGGAAVTTITPAITPGNILVYSNNSGRVNKLRGFEFTGINGLHGIELLNGKVIVEECQFVDNVLEGEIGGAIMVWDKAEIRNCLFENNRGGKHGGGIRWVNYGGGIVEHNEFKGNEAMYGGGIDLLYAKNVLVRYNLFVADSSLARGGAIYVCGAGNIRIVNNTIDSCVSISSEGGGLGGCAGRSDAVYNNIIVNCKGNGIWLEGQPALAYNDCYSNAPRDYYIDYDPFTGGEGAISVDPQFVGTGPNPYYLAPTSPCINAGNFDTLYADPDGTRNDMGAYSFYGAGSPLAVRLGFGSGSVNGYVVVLWPTIYWHYLDTTVASQTQFEIEVGTDQDWSVAEMWQSGVIASSDTAAVYAGVLLANRGTYFLRMRVANSSGWGEWIQIVMQMGIGRTIRIPADQPIIQAGIDLAVDGDTVLVAPGSYAANLLISGKGIYLLSELGADNTSVTPATTAGNILTLDHITGKSNTIRGFEFTGVQGTHCIESRGGTCITVENCDFVDNVVGDIYGGSYGGALLVRGTGIIRDNRFVNNRGDVSDGGGIRIAEGGYSIIERNEFRHNSASCGAGIDLSDAINVIVRYNLFVADSAAEYGGAIYLRNATKIRMINNTIDSCVSPTNNGGGISILLGSTDTLLNNIITNCSGYGIWRSASGSCSANYDDCWSNLPADYLGIAPGAGSLSIDPHFVGGIPFSYHLQGSSPCINAGNPDPLYNDLDGSRNDMGRYFYTMTLGDANGDGYTNISDVVFLINYIFLGGMAPQPLMVGDNNCDGSINIGDVVYLIRYLFSGGQTPCVD